MKEEYFMRVGIPETSAEEVKETLARIETLLGVEAIKEDKYAISMDAGMMSGYLPLFPYRGHISEVGDFACFTFDIKSLVTRGDWKEKRKELSELLKTEISEEIRVPGLYRVSGTDLTLGFELIREGRKPVHEHSTVSEIVEESYRFYAGEDGEKVLTKLYGETA